MVFSELKFDDYQKMGEQEHNQLLQGEAIGDDEDDDIEEYEESEADGQCEADDDTEGEL